MNATAKKTWPCAWCETPIHENNCHGVGEDDLCEYCYDDATYICGFCGEREENPCRGLVVAFSRLMLDEDQRMRPGVYQVVHWPYYVDAMVYSYVLARSFRRIGDGPAWLETAEKYDPCGDDMSPAYHLCARCGIEHLPRRTRSGMWSCAGKRYRTRALALRRAARLHEAHAAVRRSSW